jgi:hypothetical protein
VVVPESDNVRIDRFVSRCLFEVGFHVLEIRFECLYVFVLKSPDVFLFFFLLYSRCVCMITTPLPRS